MSFLVTKGANFNYVHSTRLPLSSHLTFLTPGPLFIETRQIGIFNEDCNKLNQPSTIKYVYKRLFDKMSDKHYSELVRTESEKVGLCQCTFGKLTGFEMELNSLSA